MDLIVFVSYTCRCILLNRNARMEIKIVSAHYQESERQVRLLGWACKKGELSAAFNSGWLDINIMQLNDSHVLCIVL